MAELPRVPSRVSNQRSGCLTVLYVVLGLVLVLLVTFGIGTWLFVRSDTGQQIIRTAKDGFTLLKDATTAPGTSELRAQGCEQALVMPVDRMMELVSQIAPEMEVEVARAKLPGNGTMIVCQSRSEVTRTPGCDEVARIYAAAVPKSPDRFGVVVQDAGAREPKCQGTYTRDGTFVEPFNQPDRREPDGAEPPGDQPVEAPAPPK